MKKLFFITAFSVTALVSASNVVKKTTLPTPKDIIKYGEKELNTTCSFSVTNGPGDDDIIINPPKR